MQINNERKINIRLKNEILLNVKINKKLFWQRLKANKFINKI
jgi:hypothetical protein